MPTVQVSDRYVSVRRDAMLSDMSRSAKGLLMELLCMSDRTVLEADDDTIAQAKELVSAGYLVIDESHDTWHVTDSPSLVLSKPPKQTVFEKPTPEMVESFAKSKGAFVDGERFCDYYETQGWLLKNGRHMKSWRSAVSTWIRREKGGHKLSDVFAAYED